MGLWSMCRLHAVVLRRRGDSGLRGTLTARRDERFAQRSLTLALGNDERRGGRRTQAPDKARNGDVILDLAFQFQFIAAPPDTLDFPRLHDLASRHQLTAYDTAYLDLAKRLALPLATLDDDLKDAALAEGLIVL